MTRNRGLRWAGVALACALALAAAAPAEAAARKTVVRELQKLYVSGKIPLETYAADRAIHADVKRTIKALTGARRAELAGVLAGVEAMAARGKLRATRLAPLFLTLQRNAEWWSSEPLLSSGQRISFPGSELVWQYVPGQGLQFHPLATFGKLNAYAKSRRNTFANALLLDELLDVAVGRGGGLAWEYYFTFAGGRPPWVSGLAQGTGLQAIARSAVKLGRLPELLPRIQEGLELFERAPPTGVRVESRRGVHYAQYSFWPSLRVLNGFVQSLVGIYDVAELTGDARAAKLFEDGERSARAEVLAHDTGAWSLYSRGAITRESDLGYHTLLRDFLTGLCERTERAEYCETEAHFTAYLDIPPALKLRTARVRGGRSSTLKFSLSKIAQATVSAFAPSGKRVLYLGTGTIGRGTRSIAWQVPEKAGRYVVRIDATDLAGNAASVQDEVEVLRKRKRRD